MFKKINVFLLSIFPKSYLIFVLLLFVFIPEKSFAVYPPFPENLVGTSNEVKVVTDENQHAMAAYRNTDFIPARINTYYFSQNVWTDLPFPLS